MAHYLFKPKTTEAKTFDNIKNYSNHKVLYRLSKPRSHHEIVFLEHENDPWFIWVKTYKTKSGDIIDSSFIVKPDLETWVSRRLDSLGYELKK